MLVSHNSFVADTIHFVFLEIRVSLDWRAMSQIPWLTEIHFDTFRGKQAVLFTNLLGKGLTQENNHKTKSEK